MCSWLLQYCNSSAIFIFMFSYIMRIHHEGFLKKARQIVESRVEFSIEFFFNFSGQLAPKVQRGYSVRLALSCWQSWSLLRRESYRRWSRLMRAMEDASRTQTPRYCFSCHPKLYMSLPLFVVCQIHQIRALQSCVSCSILPMTGRGVLIIYFILYLHILYCKKRMRFSRPILQQIFGIHLPD